MSLGIVKVGRAKGPSSESVSESKATWCHGDFWGTFCPSTEQLSGSWVKTGDFRETCRLVWDDLDEKRCRSVSYLNLQVTGTSWTQIRVDLPHFPCFAAQLHITRICCLLKSMLHLHSVYFQSAYVLWKRRCEGSIVTNSCSDSSPSKQDVRKWQRGY